MTLVSIKARAPCLGPVTEAVEISLKIVMVLLTTSTMHWGLQEAFACKEAYLRVNAPGQVTDIKQKEE